MNKEGVAIDPVCGMKVDRATAKLKTEHAGHEYFFCSAGCQTKFQSNPAGVLASGPKGMGSGARSPAGPASIGLVSIGIAPAPKPAAHQDAPPHPHPSQLPPANASPAYVGPMYVCPMCAEVR
ncbi:MAG: YHS domain-containing protein, partial [Terriglobales bacterium]